MPKLKNTHSDSTRTFDRIQKCLADHKVKQMMFEYDDNGRIVALMFSLEVEGKTFGYKLPARFENVEKILFENRIRHRYSPLTQAQKDQAYRTAWANIRDWLEAQMALIDTAMVKAEEVLLPYMVDTQTGKTYYEALRDNDYYIGLPPPKNNDDDVI